VRSGGHPCGLGQNRGRTLVIRLRKEVKMKVLIYGAGVIGSLYAARLKQGGHDVTLLARGQRLADLRKRGLEMEDLITGERLTMTIDAVDALGPEDRYDLVITLVPKHCVAEILPALSANHLVPCILFLGNNAAGPEALAAAVGRERVLMGFPGAAGTREGNLVRFMDSRKGRRFPVIVGAPYPEATARLPEAMALFRQAGTPALLERRIDDWLKSHAAFILPLAGATYMTDMDVARLADTRDALVMLARSLRESMGALRAAGVTATPFFFRLLRWLPEPLLVYVARRRLRTPAAQHGLSHAHGARQELAHLAQEFSELSSASGYSMPITDFLCAHIAPEAEPLPGGSTQLPLDWRGVWRDVALLMGAVAVWTMVRIYRRERRALARETREL